MRKLVWNARWNDQRRPTSARPARRVQSCLLGLALALVGLAPRGTAQAEVSRHPVVSVALMVGRTSSALPVVGTRTEPGRLTQIDALQHFGGTVFGAELRAGYRSWSSSRSAAAGPLVGVSFARGTAHTVNLGVPFAGNAALPPTGPGGADSLRVTPSWLAFSIGGEAIVRGILAATLQLGVSTASLTVDETEARFLEEGRSYAFLLAADLRLRIPAESSVVPFVGLAANATLRRGFLLLPVNGASAVLQLGVETDFGLGRANK